MTLRCVAAWLKGRSGERRLALRTTLAGLGSDIPVMLALRRCSRQVVVTDEKLNGPDMIRPTVSILMIPLVYCHINSLQRAASMKKPFPGGENRRDGRAAHHVEW